MEKSNLDIWAIEKDKDEIFLALENIKDSDTNILFNNCMTRVKLGSKRLKIAFDTVFYSEDSDTLILLMKNGPLSVDEFKTILDNKDISYNEVCFYPLDLRKRSTSEKEIWFAREKYVLEDALKDSLEKGIASCRYYPTLTGNMDFSYFISRTRMKSFDSQHIKGVIEFEDKIVLFISNGYSKNITQQEALEILANSSITAIIDESEELKSEINPNQKTKKYN